MVANGTIPSPPKKQTKLKHNKQQQTNSQQLQTNKQTKKKKERTKERKKMKTKNEKKLVRVRGGDLCRYFDIYPMYSVAFVVW